MASTSFECTIDPNATLTSNQTALAILLPPYSALYQNISTLRSLYDRNSKIWPPHINVLYPFVAPEYIPNVVENIQQYFVNGRGEEEASAGLNINLNTAGIFKQKDSATIYIAEEARKNNPEKHGLVELRRGLLKLFTTSKVKNRPYVPHLTIGQTALDEEVMMGLLGKAEKLVANADGGIHFNAYRLVVLQRGAARSGMRIVSEIVLNKNNNKGNILQQDADNSETVAMEQEVPRNPGLNPVYVYSAAAGSYIPYTPRGNTHPKVQELTLATYNIFAESAIPTEPATSRYPSLLSAILSTTASVINLQEVTDDFLQFLLSQPEIQKRFPYSTHSLSYGILPSWRNCVTLSIYPLGDEKGMWEFVDLGRRHKGAVIVELCVRESGTRIVAGDGSEGEKLEGYKTKKLVIANVHLTCGISDGSTAAKVTQLRLLTSYFLLRPVSKSCTETWAVCGDFNIPTSLATIQNSFTSKQISLETYQLLHRGEDENQKGLIPKIWRDTYDQTHSLYDFADVDDVKFDIGRTNTVSGNTGADNSIALGPGEFGATFNPFTNQLAAEGVKWGANPRPQRYDRILVARSVGFNARNWLEVKRTGRFGLEGGSDHWGLYAEFTIHDAETGHTELQTTKLGQKKWLEVGPRVPAEANMTNKTLEKYLYESGMLPSQHDYSIREEAKEVLTLILTAESQPKQERHFAAVVDPLTLNHHLHTPSDGHSELLEHHHDVDSIPTNPLLLQSQRAGVPEKQAVKIIVQPVGSYYMNLFTPSSDLDMLCASNISPRIFWVLVKQRIRRHNRTLSKAGRKAGRVRIIRTVEAQSGTMMEMEYIGGSAGNAATSEAGELEDAKPEAMTDQGSEMEDAKAEAVTAQDVGQTESKYYRVRIDLQYCQVPERVLDSWTQLPHLPSTDQLFSLSATTLKKLNAYRDSSYLLRSVPNLKLFRLTYRYLKLWAIRRGIFSARFGYLGGIHLVLLLSRLFKSIPTHQVMDLTAGEILKLFFENYAGFNYEEDTVSDPDFSSSSEYRRTASREPFAISTIHSPMINVAHTASKHTLKTLRDEILLANQKLDRNCGWDAVTGRADGEAERDFLNAFGNFVKIDLRYWGKNIQRGRSLVGWIESRCVMLLVELNAKVPNMHARMWPGRFVSANDPHTDEELNGFYLIGLLNTTPSQRNSPGQRTPEGQELDEQKKRAYNKFMDILRSFETYLRQEEKSEVTEAYIAVTTVSRQALGDGVRIDKQVWWDEEIEVGDAEGSYNAHPHEGDDDGEDSLDEADSDLEPDQEEGGPRHPAGPRGSAAARAVPQDHSIAGIVNMEDNNESSKQAPPKRTGRSQQKREQLERERHPNPDDAAHLAIDGLEVTPTTKEYTKKAKLRPAHDIINRIKWDSELDIHDYVIGYEDRFLGVMQMGLEKWIGHRKDETDEEWVPLHRVVWVKRVSDGGAVVWDRERRIDTIFGSGEVGAEVS